jgi:hypothetical protein
MSTVNLGQKRALERRHALFDSVEFPEKPSDLPSERRGASF